MHLESIMAKKNYLIIPYSVEPVLTGQPVLKGLHAIPHG